MGIDDLIRLRDRWYIAADSSYADDRAWVLNEGDTFGVFDRWGDVHPLGRGVQGVYHADTRYVSSLRLTLDGRRPLLLSSTVREQNDVLTVDLTNPALPRADGGTVPQGVIHVHRTGLLRAGAHYGELVVTNHDTAAHVVTVSLRIEADFRDIFEVRGTPRARRGTLREPDLDEHGPRYAYVGLDGVERATEVFVEPAPSHLATDGVDFRLALEPGRTARIVHRLGFRRSDAVPTAHASRNDAVAAQARDYAQRRARFATIETSSRRFDHWLARSRADLVSLIADTPHGPYPYAGVPWFNTPFGRDGLLTALEMLWVAPDVARGVLRYVAATQATVDDAYRDAEPGKAFHEVRGGEMAALGEVPFARYYGSVDATPLYVALAGAYLARTGDVATIGALWPSLEAALAWIDGRADSGRDGFVDYRARHASGLANQGWKDSYDSVSHADGRLAPAPIALCEVQGYAYAAWRAAARMAHALGDADAALGFERRARALRERFDAVFWLPALDCYALACDASGALCAVRSSNAGQCLWTGIALPERAAPLAGTLLSDALYSGWGVRTLASDAARYNPMSYHNGSVWPHDCALVAYGLSRYGLVDAAQTILEGLYDASTHLNLQRLPELFCGFPRREGEGPTAYPVACSPQAWAVGAPFLLLQAVLGLDVDADAREVQLRHPRLPREVDWLRIRDWQLGGASAELHVARRDGRVDVTAATLPEGWRVTVVP
jgi:glycogen debranching enzyme